VKRVAILDLVLLALAAALGSPSCSFHGQLPVTGCDSGTKDGDETDVDCGGSCGPCADKKTCAEAADCTSNVCAAGTCDPPTCADDAQNGTESDVNCGGASCSPCSEGQRCGSATDCATGACVGALCVTASCSDAIKNAGESDVDCGGPCADRCKDGQACGGGSDCASGVCVASRCAPATCVDGVKNGGELASDCGGGCPCADGSPCEKATDCLSLKCTGGPPGTCQPPACNDTVKNGTETDTDCGGGCAPCADGSGCAAPADCASGVCLGGICKVPNCGDGAKNGSETGVDCGGPCLPCDDGKVCAAPADCTSGVCSGAPKTCQAPLCTDNVKNGSETDTDCGGSCPNQCASAQGCTVPKDCQSGVCSGTPKACQAPACGDGVKNGGETDVDCGGPCAKCQDLKGCAATADCQSGVCSGAPKACQPAHCTDGVKNGSETDTDCGGGCPACSNAKTCGGDLDCASGRCDAAKKCGIWSKAFALGVPYNQKVVAGPGGRVLAGFYTSVATDVGGGSALPPGFVVAEYDRTGAHTWSRSLGGGFAIAFDGSGAVLLAGVAASGNFGGGFLPGHGANDVVAVKLSSQGVHAWSRLYGGSSDDSASGLAVDANGDVLVTGVFSSATLDFGGGVTLTHNAAASAQLFVAKIAGATGNVMWAKAFGDAFSQGNTVAVDAAGQVFVTGTFGGSLDFGGGTLTAPPGTFPAFVAKLTGANGAPVWSRAFYGYSDQGTGLAVDGAGDVVVAGYGADGSDFGGGPRFAGNGVAFLAKLSGQSGAHLWSQMFVGANTAGATRGVFPSVALDAAGNIVLAGGFSDPQATFGAKTVVNANPGALDAFVARFDGVTGTALSAKSFGAAGDDWIESVAVDRATGNVLVSGGFSQSINLGDGAHTVASPYGFFVASLGPVP
jgi:hypothetical protein